MLVSDPSHDIVQRVHNRIVVFFLEKDYQCYL
jgi:hypothetical protein